MCSVYPTITPIRCVDENEIVALCESFAYDATYSFRRLPAADEDCNSFLLLLIHAQDGCELYGLKVPVPDDVLARVRRR